MDSFHLHSQNSSMETIQCIRQTDLAERIDTSNRQCAHRTLGLDTQK